MARKGTSVLESEWLPESSTRCRSHRRPRSSHHLECEQPWIGHAAAAATRWSQHSLNKPHRPPRQRSDVVAFAGASNAPPPPRLGIWIPRTRLLGPPHARETLGNVCRHCIRVIRPERDSERDPRQADCFLGGATATDPRLRDFGQIFSVKKSFIYLHHLMKYNK